MSSEITDTYSFNQVAASIEKGELQSALNMADNHAEEHRQQSEAWANWAARIALKSAEIRKKI